MGIPIGKLLGKILKVATLVQKILKILSKKTKDI